MGRTRAQFRRRISGRAVPARAATIIHRLRAAGCRPRDMIRVAARIPMAPNIAVEAPTELW